MMILELVLTTVMLCCPFVLPISISHVHDPRALGQIFEKAEKALSARLHPDPYIRACTPLLTMLKISLGFSSSSGYRTWRYQMVR